MPSRKDQAKRVEAVVRARAELSDEFIAKYLHVSICMVSIAWKRLESELGQRGVNSHLSEASKIATTHGVSPRTARRWLKNNDVPPVESVKVEGTDFYDITKKRARRTDRDVAPRSACGPSLRSALSFLKLTDKYACQSGCDARDHVRLARIIETATEMAQRWGQATS